MSTSPLQLSVGTGPLRAGPVLAEVESDHGAARGRVLAVLAQYDVPWAMPGCKLSIRVTTREPTSRSSADRVAEGGYLTCMRFSVEREGTRYWGESRVGLTFSYDDQAGDLRVTMPSVPGVGDLERDALEELEQLVTFALTQRWQKLGWLPLHAGTVCSPGGCALLCTHSGGGKSTLVAAMLRRGFKTLGDDKVLVRAETGDAPLAVAVARDTNLHPRSQRWFPEVGDLESMPTYSHWTQKRKLRIQSPWPGCQVAAARPTHVLLLERTGIGDRVTLAPMSAADTLGALMRQVVIPNDRARARAIVGELTALGGACRGYVATIPDDVYDRPHATAAVEELLR